MELRKCPECEKEYENSYFEWVKDRYGIPYKKVCVNCSIEVEEKINQWEYDYLDAGEYL